MMWSILVHEHVLPFLGICRTRDHFYLVTPFSENGPLPAYLRLHPNADRPRLVSQTTVARSVLLMHRDHRVAV